MTHREVLMSREAGYRERLEFEQRSASDAGPEGARRREAPSNPSLDSLFPTESTACIPAGVSAK